MAAFVNPSCAFYASRAISSLCNTHLCSQDSRHRNNVHFKLHTDAREFFVGQTGFEALASDGNLIQRPDTKLSNVPVRMEVTEDYSMQRSRREIFRQIGLQLAAAAVGASIAPGKARALKPFVDSTDGYEVLYPDGWLQYPFKKGGPDVAFRDLINQEETLSVLIESVDKSKTLETLGTPEEVGKRIAAADGDTLVRSSTRDRKDVTYYDFEFTGKLHKLASIAISRGKLFTLTITTSEKRWNKVKPAAEEVIKTFYVYPSKALKDKAAKAVPGNFVMPSAS